ncbi:heterokaryon incompatibility protein [Colletotrichum kahawae]|uniref:Heterokaryon incompatibility protein n=1 Tax=Colletotrichum kahawae TaxID=34407 RepID=A0AAD9YPD6_COLKA|nr:heterokaryon incompatibility protein [Colletotrichum kahawae]
MIHLNRLEGKLHPKFQGTVAEILDADSPLPETPLILAGSTASPSSLNQALNWFKKCKTNHEKCRSPPTARSGWLPTRLVDIGIPGEPDWKLRITKDLDKTSSLEYMTLSYRWGPKPEHLLLTDNIDDLQGGWPVKTLPQTFQDFILVARQFGVRYVWIDRLCIIQDDEKDWKAEAPMMASVYSNSMCNVCASASDSPEGGLFRNRAAKSIAPGIVDTTLTIAPTTSPVRCYIYPRRYWDDHLPEAPLHCRGWVYQERFFASRVIYFSPQQVMWECLEESGCEGFPKGDVNPYPADHMKGFKTLGSLADLISGPSGFTSSELLNAWEVSVESYSRCQLTRTEDKLYAFSGISKFFQQAAGDRYLAGMWQSVIVNQLCWYTHGMFPTPSEYRAPSWSWASVDGPVFSRSGDSLLGGEKVVKVIDLDVTTEGADSTVEVKSGFLRLRGTVFVACCWTDYGDHGGGVAVGEYLGFLGDRSRKVMLFPDTSDRPLQQAGRMILLPIMRFPTGVESSAPAHLPRYHVGCLVLSAWDHPTIGNIYQRSGYLFTKDIFWSGASAVADGALFDSIVENAEVTII